MELVPEGWRTGMNRPAYDAVVAICSGHTKIGQAVEKLQQSGFDMQRLSVVGNGAQAGVDESINYIAGDRIQSGCFPSGATFFNLSDIDPTAVGDPRIPAVVEDPEVNAAETERSVLGTWLQHWGIPEHNVPRYETALKSGSNLFIVHCTADEAIGVREIFDPLKVADIAVHHT